MKGKGLYFATSVLKGSLFFMSPENANVFLAEDYPQLREIAKELIEDASHTVVIEVGSLEEALKNIDIGRAKEKGVNVAVVDGNLSENDISGSDGRQIAEALRKEIPDITVISFSGQNQDYGDVHVDKNDYEQTSKLGEIITRL